MVEYLALAQEAAGSSPVNPIRAVAQQTTAPPSEGGEPRCESLQPYHPCEEAVNPTWL